MGLETGNIVQLLKYPDRPRSWANPVSSVFGIGDLAADLGQGRSDTQALRFLTQRNIGETFLGRSACLGESYLGERITLF